MTGLHQRLSDGRKNRCHCEKNDNHSAIDYPAWMIGNVDGTGSGDRKELLK